MNDATLQRLRALVRDVPDFPKPGILFKDITPVLADATAFRAAIARMTEPYANEDIDVVLGIEARGFMFAAPIALALGASFVPVRKPGKLPSAVERVEYALEYGSDALEVHADAIPQRAKVLIVDDVLATGGTAAAVYTLAQRAGGIVVGASFLIELAFLNGGAKLDGLHYDALLRY